MSTYKKFWQNKPILRRIAAFVILVFMPVVLPLLYLFLAWREILDAFAGAYADTWKTLVERDNA